MDGPTDGRTVAFLFLVVAQHLKSEKKKSRIVIFSVV